MATRKDSPMKQWRDKMDGGNPSRIQNSGLFTEMNAKMDMYDRRTGATAEKAALKANPSRIMAIPRNGEAIANLNRESADLGKKIARMKQDSGNDKRRANELMRIANERKKQSPR